MGSHPLPPESNPSWLMSGLPVLSRCIVMGESIVQVLASFFGGQYVIRGRESSDHMCSSVAYLSTKLHTKRGRHVQNSRGRLLMGFRAYGSHESIRLRGGRIVRKPEREVCDLDRSRRVAEPGNFFFSLAAEVRTTQRRAQLLVLGSQIGT